MGVTKIEWTATTNLDGTMSPGYTFNPWRGCTKVSHGCTHCYAEQMGRRNPAVLGEWGPKGRRVIAAESAWKQPLKWDRDACRDGVRRRVFCGSMCDVFEDNEQVLDAREHLAAVILATPNLDWLLLTKRPENIARLASEVFAWDVGAHGTPLNVWIGTSVEDQATADGRIPRLVAIPAVVRFLSVEPLLGPVTLDLSGIHWVIVGGESGPHARPCDMMWIRSVVGQCKAAGVPAFVKQLGACPESTAHPIPGVETHVKLKLDDRKGGEPSEWPEDLRVREFPRGVEGKR